MNDPSPPPVLRAGRCHEAGGPGAAVFAAIAAARSKGPVLWVRPAHLADLPMPGGLAHFFDPARLVIVRAPDETDLLWSAEEALRSGAAPLVIAEPLKPLSLTAGRRLQLAAEAGRSIGLLLIREGAGSNAAETRWRCAPVPAEDGGAAHRWVLVKNKSGPGGAWLVRWEGRAEGLRVMPGAATG